MTNILFAPGDMPFLRQDTHGDVMLDIRVIPNAIRTQLDGLYGATGQPALKVRLHAPPIDGKANEALIKWLAKELGVPRTSLELVLGHTSRRKQVRISKAAAETANWMRLASTLE